ncbi:MAG: hypothetical protein KJ025_06145 [Burkholderiales bacterium]|nr:hypothetical protein [Burkholderiales bacterium]
MIREFGIVRDAAARVAGAAERVTGALREGRVEQEPAFTDRMLGAIEGAMHDYQAKGISWSAKTLTDRGPNAQERQHGADFMGVLSIDLPAFTVKKGFLAQAKLIEPGGWVSKDEFERMKAQCERMLSRTPDSFVFLYARAGVTIVPAISILSSERCNPHEFYSRSISRFYEEHFESFIGDRRLHAPTPGVLDEIRRDLDARSLLYLEAHFA